MSFRNVRSMYQAIIGLMLAAFSSAQRASTPGKSVYVPPVLEGLQRLTWDGVPNGIMHPARPRTQGQVMGVCKRPMRSGTGSGLMYENPWPRRRLLNRGQIAVLQGIEIDGRGNVVRRRDSRSRKARARARRLEIAFLEQTADINLTPAQRAIWERLGAGRR